MNVRLFLETIRHLRLRQIVYQVWYKVYHPCYKQYASPVDKVDTSVIHPVEKYVCLEGETFSFLNIRDAFSGWSTTEHGMLWAYNLNYMDWLNQTNITREEGEKWIDCFIKDLPNHRIGLDAAPIALRCMNWMKFLMKYPESATKFRLDALYSQILLLSHKLEYHLLGNHLLEDAYTLFFSSVFFRDKKLFQKSTSLLSQQLEEQVLPDGAHYEQSPMYHCIMLDRLLDCYNISTNNIIFENQKAFNERLKSFAERMLGHLKAIIYEDETFPMLNDSAGGVAPCPHQLFDYAERLGIAFVEIPMQECGYKKFAADGFEAIIDVGNITAQYQPGHTHADTFNYELRIQGQPVIVDTGISTYDKTSRRQYERSTLAHNTVSVNGQDSSRVWGGFRVGKRANVYVHTAKPNEVKATHDGFGKSCLHTRTFLLDKEGFHIEDQVDAKGEHISYIHLAPSLKPLLTDDGSRIVLGNQEIAVEGAIKTEVLNNTISTEYNRFEESVVLAIHFGKKLSYTVRQKK